MPALLQLDSSIVTTWNHYLSLHPSLGHGVAFIALYGAYTIPIVWVVWWFVAGRRQRELLLSAIFAGIVAWVGLNRLIKALYFHSRPINSLPVKELLFARPENSFPSDHAAFLFAIAFFFLFRRNPRAGGLILALAIVTSLARIAVAVHYPTDILGGLASGLISAWIITTFHDWLVSNVWDRLITLAKRLHLA